MFKEEKLNERKKADEKENRTDTVVCNTYNPSVVKTVSRHEGTVWSMEFLSYDGKYFIGSGSGDNKVCLWDLMNPRPMKTFCGHDDVPFKKLIGHSDCVMEIHVSPFNKGEQLCSASWDGTIRLWNLKTDEQKTVCNTTSSFWTVQFSPLQNDIDTANGTGYTICAGSYNGTIHLWDIEKTKELNTFKKNNGVIRSVQYSPFHFSAGGFTGGNTICSGSQDRKVCLWDTRTQQESIFFEGHTDDVYCVKFLSSQSAYSKSITKSNDQTKQNVIINSNVICSGSSDNTIRFWDVRNNKQLHAAESNFGDNGVISLQFQNLTLFLLPHAILTTTTLFYVLGQIMEQSTYGRKYISKKKQIS
ncbi:WD repeat-containing protein [Reticulomyxa filosa]|uniref:WD repeat-containing protein n=1 Tax=Reticulomyxa filosa TaxID=46433 RepID=X6LFI0_RETFI|nr:WD repeat-containing protein [Reticulomyxa filosa]|eukprot:ETO00319.1 WD repeat-containing protein [Reticulomyxa filosa]